MRDDLEHLFHADGVEFHPQYVVNSVELTCHLLLEIGAITITDPLAPLAIDPGSFAAVPLEPLRMLQTSIYTPVLTQESRSTTQFKLCLHEEAKEIEKRAAALLRKPALAGKARRPGQTGKSAK